MQDLYPGSTHVPDMSRLILEKLPNKNKFKPTVWAQRKKDHKYYGVSLGVRSFVRPLYLFSKLRNLLSDNFENNVELDDVQALTHKIKKGGDGKHDDEKSQYSEPIYPCISCQIFFNDRNHLQYFGNCAEYDVIRNRRINSKLYDLLKHTYEREWLEVKSSCEKQLEAFRDFTQRKNETARSQNNVKEILKTYYKNAYGTKSLRYKWSMNGYTLIAKSKAKGV